MKLLSIGNSFSEDAHRWLHQLAQQQGFELETVNLYIGGCSLETHWKNVQEDNAFYDLERNGNLGTEKISIYRALVMEKWDIVTLQQVSQYAGMPMSYEPYLGELAAYVRKLCPGAALLFHQTWAYEIDSEHSGFANYRFDQKLMAEKIISVSGEKAQSIDAAVIPTGAVIQHLRETLPEFDYKNGGMSLCRDGFHLTLDYGRYAAAAVWLSVLMNKPLIPMPFADFDGEITAKIVAAVNACCL